MARIHNPREANEIESWARQWELTSQVLPGDAACFREYSRLIPAAPIRRVHGLTIATRNERDFKRFSVPLFNPFR
jgi:hypothetical protein